MSKFLSKSKRKAQPLSSVPQIVIDCIEVLEERGIIQNFTKEKTTKFSTDFNFH